MNFLILCIVPDIAAIIVLLWHMGVLAAGCYKGRVKASCCILYADVGCTWDHLLSLLCFGCGARAGQMQSSRSVVALSWLRIELPGRME